MVPLIIVIIACICVAVVAGTFIDWLTNPAKSIDEWLWQKGFSVLTLVLMSAVATYCGFNGVLYEPFPGGLCIGGLLAVLAAYQLMRGLSSKQRKTQEQKIYARECHCPLCRYSLEGLQSDTCPECGWALPIPPAKENDA